ncbi:substrate-binding periplasmic protein [Bowmanella dokdonensis]|uniref:Transporter substrate-binding domain-containing protein n=1 Tax=Bowmanella dokdonensis TaxID=751969 RepID=A0A939DRI9_9ALTE|nr:transporter substrate-binding domain-containing protein [Bowmanella dokdonensis]MBN7827497.1 transporter substrate-binding domain-containing protein [Bowmanella dokdonensis]
MKKLSILCASLMLTGQSVFADTISIRADEWYPINGEPGAAKPGFMIELAEKVFGAAGHTVDYKLMPWERALDSVRKGDFDCVVGAYKEDAPDFVFPDEFWGYDDTAFFTRSGHNWSFDGLDSLLTQKVAVINGYAYGDELDALIEANPGVFQGLGGNDALEKNIKKLEAGRVDVVIESPSVMQAKLKDMGVSGIGMAGTMNEPSEMYIACSPAKASSKDYVALVDKGTRALRESGELDAILAKYGMSDWK